MNPKSTSLEKELTNKRIEELRRRFAQKRIGVLMGGWGGEREVSLRSGKGVLDALKRQGIDAVGFDPKEKEIEGLKREGVDIVFVALHGGLGEDGCIQGTLEILGLPYTGSGVLASALAMNKVASKRIFEAGGIPTPPFKPIEEKERVDEECGWILKEMGLPLVAKPVAEGSSLGVEIVRRAEDLIEIVNRIIQTYGDAFVEKFIQGHQVTVGILGVGKETQALPILELIPKREFYDYKAKYTKGLTDFIIPAPLKENVYEETQRVALKAHQILGCHGFSRVDIIVGEDDVPYVHDVNTIPGLTETSDLPAQARASGISYDELILRMLESAIRR